MILEHKAYEWMTHSTDSENQEDIVGIQGFQMAQSFLVHMELGRLICLHSCGWMQV